MNILHWHKVVHKLSEFKSFVRLYREKGEITVTCGKSSFVRGYQYFGRAEILHRTDLSDKANSMMMNALASKKPYAAFGPAGTGKTETAKDLALKLG